MGRTSIMPAVVREELKEFIEDSNFKTKFQNLNDQRRSNCTEQD